MTFNRETNKRKKKKKEEKKTNLKQQPQPKIKAHPIATGKQN